MSADGPDFSNEVEFIASCPEALTEEQAAILWNAIQSRLASIDIDYGANFDIVAEVEAQIALVRAMRRSVVTAGGQLMPGIATRELKEVVSASTTMLTTLSKSHEKIMSFDRIRAIETSTVDAVKTLPAEQQTIFFETLERKLSAIE